MTERERERESKKPAWALIVDGRRLHIFMNEPHEDVKKLTALKGIRLEPVRDKGEG